MAGDLRRLRGDRDKKKRSSLYRSCLHERVILPDYRITSLLQFIHHFYNTFTTLLRPVHHFYNTFASLLHHLYITFTSFLQLIRHFHPLCHLYITPFLNVLTAGFPAAPATLHGHAINCVPVHRFRMGRTPETGLPLAEWCEFPRYALARILMHAVKTEPARFWRVFGWFVACFTGFPSETPSEPLRRCTQGMLCLIGLTVRYKKKPLGGFFFCYELAIFSCEFFIGIA